MGYTKRKIPVEDIVIPGAGKTAIIKPPVGPRYHRLILELGDSAAGSTAAPTVASIIGEMRMKFGKNIPRRITGARQDVLSTLMGSNFATQTYVGGSNGLGRTHLVIPLSETWRKRGADADALAWQTGWLSQLGKDGIFQIFLDVQSGITPVINCWAVVDDFDSKAPHSIIKMDTHDFQATGTPTTITTLPRRLYNQMSIFNTSGGKSVAAANMKVGSVPLHDMPVNVNTTDLKSADMNPAAGAYHMVWDEDDGLDDVITDLNRDLTLKIDWSAAPSAESMSIVTQYLGMADVGND